MLCPMRANDIALSCTATYRKRTGQLLCATGSKNPLALAMGSVKGQRVESLLGVEYEINGTKGFFVRLNIERQGKEAVRKCLAELYGCDERNMLFKGNSSDEPLWML